MDIPKIKVAIIQPVIPSYRIALFDYLAQFMDLDITCFYSKGNRYDAKNFGQDLVVKNEEVPALYFPFRAPPAYQQIVWRVIKGNFDVVVCSQSINNIATLTLWFLRKMFGYKFVWWGIGFDPYRQKDPYTKPETLMGKSAVMIKDYLWKRSDSLLVYSEEGKRYSLERNIPEDKISVLKNTIHVEQLQNDAKNVTPVALMAIRKELQLDDSSFVYLFVGRLHKRKEVPFLIKAYSTIASELKDTKLIIVGDGEDYPLTQRLITEFGLQKQVLLVGAVYDKNRLAELFLTCDVVTLPGQVGLTVIHSFAYGKPVITKKSISYSPELEYLRDGCNGIIVQDNEVDTYAKAMKKIYLDSKLREALSAEALATANKTTMQSMANNFRAGLLSAID